METGEIIIYQTQDGKTSIDVKLQNDTVWLNQYQLAELFSTDRTSLTKHIHNIYRSEELKKEATCTKIAQVQREGKRTVKREVEHYNLDLIISVGYRLSQRGGKGSKSFIFRHQEPLFLRWQQTDCRLLISCGSWRK